MVGASVTRDDALVREECVPHPVNNCTMKTREKVGAHVSHHPSCCDVSVSGRGGGDVHARGRGELLGDPQGDLHRGPGHRVRGQGEAAVQAVAQGDLLHSPGQAEHLTLTCVNKD